MTSLTSEIEKRLFRNFIIFHPSDFSAASEVAFAHALKIALKSTAKLDLMHVKPPDHLGKSYWLNFPAIRATLSRWQIWPEGGQRPEIAKAGLHIRKVLKPGVDPLETMLRHFEKYPPDLIVLATHQREGLDRWLHKAIAEPLARRSQTMTLFIPRTGKGFVALRDGTVSLKRVLIPIDQDPQPQIALREAWLLARGLGSVEGEFRLVHVGPAGTAPVVDRLELPGWSFERVVRQGSVVPGVLQEEADWKPDLIVLATQGHFGFLDALRGSTTERVLRGACCPVLAVPAFNRQSSRL